MESEGSSAFSSSLQFVHEDPDKAQSLGAVSHGDGPDFDAEEDDDCEDSEKRPMDEPPPKKKTKGRVKIKMEFIENKLRRYTTFSKRKTGIMKKAYELSTLTGTQVMLLVASETGHVYTFATPKLQPMITSESGKALIQTCLNTPDTIQMPSRSRILSSGFEESDLSYGSPEEDQAKQVQSVFSRDPPSNSESAATSPLLSPSNPPQLSVSSLPPASPSVQQQQQQYSTPPLQPTISSPPLHGPPAPILAVSSSQLNTPSTMAPPTNYPSGLSAFHGTSLYPAHVISSSMDHLSVPPANSCPNHVPSAYLKGEPPHSPTASVPPSSPSPVYSSLTAVQAAPPPLSQLLQTSAVTGAALPGSSGMMVTDHVPTLNGEMFGPGGIMPGLVATKRPILSAGTVLYDPGLYHELSTQSAMTNSNSSSPADSHCLSVAH